MHQTRIRLAVAVLGTALFTAMLVVTQQNGSDGSPSVWVSAVIWVAFVVVTREAAFLTALAFPISYVLLRLAGENSPYSADGVSSPLVLTYAVPMYLLWLGLLVLAVRAIDWLRQRAATRSS
jgi:NADH:ubiquinone oxidoreductase subunit 6 (subunit J)